MEELNLVVSHLGVYLKLFAYNVHNLFSFTSSSSLKRTKLCGN